MPILRGIPREGTFMNESEVKIHYTNPNEKSIRIILPIELYKKLKLQCPDHGMMSQLVRKLLLTHLQSMEG